MNSTGYILGVDTSNYKTSIAITDNRGNIICDLRDFLDVKQGERGLRQSEALFQHQKKLPELMKRMRHEFTGSLAAVAYSSKPRPQEGSYMPVFMAGKCFAESLGCAMNIPAFAFSHQEGHIEAVKNYSPFNKDERILACHFSGGTCELLDVRQQSDFKTDISDNIYSIDIIGKSLDISFGQVIDRAGVALGMAFPAGMQMDSTALSAQCSTAVLTPIKVRNAELNLSGIDTQMRNRLKNINREETDSLVRELFERISESITTMLYQGAEKTGVSRILMSGGVSSSRFIRQRISNKTEGSGLTVYFDESNLSQDNAVGTALLGGRKIWQ